MNKIELSSFEYTVSVLNEIATIENSSHIPFEVVWNTSLGIAKAKTVIYENNHSPVLSEQIEFDYVLQNTFNPRSEDGDSFSIVRHSVFEYFHNQFGMKRKHLLNRPDLLMKKLLELSKINRLDNTKVPEYSTIFDFETLDGSIKLPFLDSNSIEITEPISLISKS